MAELQKLTIDLTGKQILVLQGLESEEETAYLAGQIQAWLDSEDPVMVLATSDGVQVRLEKIGETS